MQIAMPTRVEPPDPIHSWDDGHKHIAKLMTEDPYWGKYTELIEDCRCSSGFSPAALETHGAVLRVGATWEEAFGAFTRGWLEGGGQWETEVAGAAREIEKFVEFRQSVLQRLASLVLPK